MTTTLSRRQLLAGSGALVVAFTLPLGVRAQTTPRDKLPLYANVDAWLAIGRDGKVTVFTGKVELGTGVQTALAQIVAEELDVAMVSIVIVQGDTGRVPDQGPTVGSKTIHLGGPQLRAAAAAARATLLDLAAQRLGVPATDLVVKDGTVSVRGDEGRNVPYATLIGGKRFDKPVSGTGTPKSPDAYRIVGTSVRRTDIPGKLTGRYLFMQDLRLPGMLHGRVIRPAAPGATLGRVDESSVAGLPGLVKVVSRGNFVGVVAQREEQAIRAARELKVEWQAPPAAPAFKDVWEAIRATPTTDRVVLSVGNVDTGMASAARTLTATYRTPFQMHASIGPSCAVAEVREGSATVWSGTQGSFGLRDALAQLLGVAPESVRLVWAEASGCYGHNGADDVAGDAVLLSAAVGRPVRVQWMRHDEHGWEPKGPAMSIDVRAGLDAQGQVVAWDYAVTTPTHSTRPAGQAGNLLAGQLTGSPPRHGFTGGDRNARHTYVFPNDRVTVRYQSKSLLRPSALRGLGAPQNTLANESFMDELAAAAGVDPIEFRRRHLKDERALAVLDAVARLSSWQARSSPRRDAAGQETVTGRGVAYAQYENENAYAAAVGEVEVNRRTGAVRVTRVWVAHDCGLIVNPDGVRNQIEGNVVQTISRALKEEVALDASGVTSLDWTAYPILTFLEAPDAIDIALIDRKDKPSVGAGEPAACPVPAMIANAIFDAVGARLRTMPFTPERVRAAGR